MCFHAYTRCSLLLPISVVRSQSWFSQGQSDDTFNQIFSKTLSLCIENLESYLSNCCDCIGLLLMIKITHAHSMVMQRRRVPVLDSFFDRVNMLLWPRFKTIFDNNLKRWEREKNFETIKPGLLAARRDGQTCD